MYESDEGGYFLQMFYRLPDGSMYPWDVPGLGQTWTLEEFQTVFNKLIPGDYESECSIN